MGTRRAATVLTVIFALLIAPVVAHGATATYWDGGTVYSQDKYSIRRTISGGSTDVQGSVLIARNRTIQAGIVLYQSEGFGFTTQTHGARTNSQNVCKWTYQAYVSGTADLLCKYFY